MDTDVIVVGAGPVGLLLAGELRLGGADVIVLERRACPATESRASTLHARTMEILDSRALLAELGEPPNEPRGHFGGIPLDLTTRSRFSGQWKVPQTRTEELLSAWADLLGADLRRGWELLAVTDEGDGVSVVASTVRGRRRLRARYVVACDGADSTVRWLTGMPFPGEDARHGLLRADVAGIDIRGRRFERLDLGVAIAARNSDGVTRVMVHEYGGEHGKPDFQQVVDAWLRVTGEDISGGIPLWVNAFDDTNRQVARYRDGRVLFAGDAAHQQLPSGGQALNLGLHEAFNLGWKLAATVRGLAPPDLLESYHDERHPVGARVLANIRTQARLLFDGREAQPLRTLLGELVALEPVRAHLADMISGLDVRYDIGDHPLLGARLPHTELTTTAGPTTTTALARTGEGLFLDFTAGAPAVTPPWAGRVRMVTACRPTSGPLMNTTAVLVRPDGHVAWISSPPTEGEHRWTRTSSSSGRARPA